MQTIGWPSKTQIQLWLVVSAFGLSLVGSAQGTPQTYTVYVDTSADDYLPRYERLVGTALSYWEVGDGRTLLGREVALRLIDNPDASLKVNWIHEIGRGLESGKTTSQGCLGQFIIKPCYIEVELGRTSGSPTGAWCRRADDSILRTLEHEIGHALGLDHSSDPQSIMAQDTVAGVPYKFDSSCNSPVRLPWELLLLFLVFIVAVYAGVKRGGRRKREVELLSRPNFCPFCGNMVKKGLEECAKCFAGVSSFQFSEKGYNYCPVCGTQTTGKDECPKCFTMVRIPSDSPER